MDAIFRLIKTPIPISILRVNPDSRDYYWVIINEEVTSQPEYIAIFRC